MAEEPKELREYPQGDEVWLVLIRKLRGFLEDEQEINHRPYTVLLYEITPRTILLDKELLFEEMKPPTAQFIWDLVLKQINEPNPAAHTGARRPKAIIFTDTKIFNQLEKKITLQHMGAKLWTEEENQGFGDDVVSEVSRKMREKKQLGYNSTCLAPGLLTVVNKERARSLFHSSSLFYKAAPWRHFAARETFVLVQPNVGARLFFLSAANAEGEGMTIGMEVNPAELFHLFKNGERQSLEGPNDYHRALMFKKEFNIPFDDLDDCDRYQWAVAGDIVTQDCFPLPINFRRDISEDMFRSTQEEVQWYDAFCRVLVKFSLDWSAKKDDPTTARGIEYELDLNYLEKPIKVKLSYYGLDFAALDADWAKIVESAVTVAPAKPALPKPAVSELDATGDVCIMCGKKEQSDSVAMKRCGQCKKKLYCSRECQLKHWPLHKPTCMKPT